MHKLLQRSNYWISFPLWKEFKLCEERCIALIGWWNVHLLLLRSCYSCNLHPYSSLLPPYLPRPSLPTYNTLIPLSSFLSRPQSPITNFDFLGLNFNLYSVPIFWNPGFPPKKLGWKLVHFHWPIIKNFHFHQITWDLHPPVSPAHQTLSIARNDLLASSVLVKLCKVFQIRNLWCSQFWWKWVKAGFLARCPSFEPSMQRMLHHLLPFQYIYYIERRVAPFCPQYVSIFWEKCKLLQFWTFYCDFVVFYLVRSKNT